MKTIGKTIVVAVMTSLSLGVVLGVVLVLFGLVHSAAGREAPVSQSLLATLLFVSAITLPLGVVGGALAGIFLRRQRVPASVLVWVVRGIGMGSIVGALGAATVPIVLTGGFLSGAAGPVLAMFSMIGAVGGVLTGAVVAVWCCRTQQSLLRLVHPGEPTSAVGEKLASVSAARTSFVLLLLASTSYGQSRDDLLSQLKDPRTAERKKALQGLRTLKEVQPDLADAVAEQLVDEDREVRLEAATTLTQLAIRLGCTLEAFPECEAFDRVLDNTPTVVHRPPPRYPRQAIERMTQGSVVVQFLVLEDGSVKEVYPVRGNAPFVQAAVEAVSKQRYEPAKRRGRPVPFAHLQVITFKLKLGSVPDVVNNADRPPTT